MNEEQYFLEAIKASEPNADLIYADWLEERGRPEADEVRNPAIVISSEWSRCNVDFWLLSCSMSESWSLCGSWSGTNSRSCSSSQCLRRSLCLSGIWYASWSRSQSWSSPYLNR